MYASWPYNARRYDVLVEHFLREYFDFRTHRLSVQLNNIDSLQDFRGELSICNKCLQDDLEAFSGIKLVAAIFSFRSEKMI